VSKSSLRCTSLQNQKGVQSVEKIEKGVEMKKKAFMAEIVTKESEKLGIIGIQVKDKAGNLRTAKAPCDVKVKAGKVYTLMVWNVREINCPMCIETKDKECKLCDGTRRVLTFSYTLRPKGKIVRAWEEKDKLIDKAKKALVRKIEKKTRVKDKLKLED